MSPARKCNHSTLMPRCASCRALKRKWYGALAERGFEDVEYGLERARYTTHQPDPRSPRAKAAESYYERVWEIYHTWRAQGRSVRDCRVAELFAAQYRDTGTVRGITRVLRAEGLAPWSDGAVQRTLKEIYAAIPGSSETTLVYICRRYASA